MSTATSDALIAAAQQGSADGVAKALADGADVNFRNVAGFTALHFAALMSHQDALARLLKVDAINVDVRCNGGWSPMLRAAHNGHVASVAKLIDAKADVHAYNDYGYQPIHWAAEKGHVDMIPVLLKAGADPAKKLNSGKTAFDLAANDDVRKALEQV